MGSTGGTTVPASDSASDASRKKGPYCARCRNHKELNRIQGHKRYCKYSMCTCTKCLYVKARQVVTANQVKEKRRSAIDEKLRSEGRLPGNSEPSIPSLQEELQSLASSTLTKTDSELDSAILDLFLARIHVDTEAFFEFVKPFIKERIRSIQAKLSTEAKSSSSSSSSSTCTQLQDYGASGGEGGRGSINTCTPSLMELRTSDTSNMYNPLKRETRTSSTVGASTVSDKMSKDNKLKKESTSRLPSLHDKSITSQLSNLQWPAFNVNCAFTQPLSTADRSKTNVLDLMATNSLVNGAPILSDEILAQYRYFKAIQQLFPSSTTYCPP